MIGHISSLSTTLHTLELRPSCDDLVDITPILTLNLPLLRSLRLSNFGHIKTLDSMVFWERHPNLQHLDLAKCEGENWFSENIPADFLPNLRHLRAPFKDTLVLAPILPQLISLSVIDSINAQVPYLLRVVVGPNGLPNLKSLDIGQKPSNSGKNDKVVGALWYEDGAGGFHQAPLKKHERSVFNGYIPSIARGTPNLEEIAFHSYGRELADFVNSSLLLVSPF
jgi:hypothetical protein